MQSSLIKHYRAAYDLRPVDEMDLPPSISVPRLLGLHTMGINWIGGYPDDEDWLSDALVLSHGSVARAPMGQTARAVVQDSDVKQVFGHIHRQEWICRNKRTRAGETRIWGFCPGCVCMTDGRVPGHNVSSQQWHNGFAVIDYDPDGTLVGIQPVSVEDGRAIWDGRVFEARDRLPEIQEAEPGWNWGE
jgi:hypothetical protein